jgi:hypothetical protein
MATVNPSALRDALSDVRFPIDKDDLVAHAQMNDAPEDVQKALRSLQPVEYRSADEVIRSVHADVGTGETAAQHSDPSRGSDQPGVADRLR